MPPMQYLAERAPMMYRIPRQIFLPWLPYLIIFLYLVQILELALLC